LLLPAFFIPTALERPSGKFDKKMAAKIAMLML
jgi:hypothetical protein